MAEKGGLDTMANGNNLLSLSPEELLEKLHRDYFIELPVDIDTPEQQKDAARIFSLINGYTSFLRYMQLRADFLKRRLKREGAPRDVIEDAQMRETAIKAYADMLDDSYSRLSRMCSVHEQAQRELYMTDGFIKRKNEGNQPTR